MVTSLVTAFVVMAVMIATVSIRGTMRNSGAKGQLTETLGAVSRRQANFRIVNQRFASWTELREQGLALPATQRVVTTNTTPFHWYLAIRDTATGVICERIGELLETRPEDRQTTCRDPGK